MISKSTIDEVFDKIDIVDVAQKLVTGLKKSGAGWTAKSPFVTEKSPSFFVVPSKGIYKCFSSGKGGNAISLIMEVNNMTYPEAIEWACDHYKIEVVRDVETKSVEEIENEKNEEKQYHGLLASCARRWKLAAAESEEFKEFIQSRGITKDDVVQWGLGWAPDTSKFLTTDIIDNGLYTKAEEIGIVKHGEKGTYDVYRNRIIFPIHSLKGKLLGFAGRIPKEEKKDNPADDFLFKAPKYINPYDSKVYAKSKVLYGWHFAHSEIRKTETTRLVEGYTDVISMHRIGLTNTVAGCGTSITAEQAKIIAKACKRVIIMLDGDKAGIKAAKRAIPLFLETGIEVLVCVIAGGEDPDGFIRKMIEQNDLLSDEEKMDEDELRARAEAIFENGTEDAIQWLINNFDAKSASPSVKGEFTKEIAELISLIPSELIRDEYAVRVVKALKVQKNSIKNLIDGIIEKREKKAQAERKKTEVLHTRSILSDDEFLPEWAEAHAKQIKDEVIFQKGEGTEYWPIGIYSPPISNNAPKFLGLERVTNYTLTPLFQISDERNGRWMVEVWNGVERRTVEIQDAALVGMDLFQKCLIPNRCYSLPKFQKFHFQMIAAMISDKTKRAWELKTLGHQPEGFFAFSNAVCLFEDGQLVVKHYDPLGIVEVKQKNYLSMGVSSIREHFRTEDNKYENDLYLKYVDSGIKFTDWANTYCQVYDDHGKFGVGFALLSIYKDMIYRIGAKCPILYLYGPKGSGKSAMGESLMNLFFSGVNVEGRLIQAVNMSPGMITDFALGSALQRFRNCPRLYNEYDPTLTEAKYRGWFKAAFDGEGRERGMGDSGGSKKTEIMKIQGTVMLAGQYLDTSDDGAVMTRSINLQFSEEKNKNRSQAQKEMWQRLNEMEKEGMSSVITELVGIRDFVWEKLRTRFFEIKKKMSEDGTKKKSSSIEERLLNNYALVYTFCDVVNEQIHMPFNLTDFYDECVDRMVNLSSQVSDGSVLFRFWNVVASMIDSKKIEFGKHMVTRLCEQLTIRVAGGSNTVKKFGSRKNVLLIRLDEMYGAYTKEMRDRGSAPYKEDVIISYLKDQPYFIGLVANVTFTSRDTSAYALDLDRMEIEGIRVLPNQVKEVAGEKVSGEAKKETAVSESVTSEEKKEAAAAEPSNEFSQLEKEQDF